jgi:hypothetical protein
MGVSLPLAALINQRVFGSQGPLEVPMRFNELVYE